MRTPSVRLAALLSTSFVVLTSTAALGADGPILLEDQPIEELIVFGRGEQQIGIAAAASEGVISGADLLVRPLLKVAELLESVPGMIAAQHSGSGKANQYFLRGFNLDHGSDFTTYIDGVPMNFRSHGHGQGYLDLNGLIAEIVDREEYRKGPYRASGGDFALAGAAYMTTIERYPTPWAAAEVGSFGWRRLATGGTFDAGGGDLTLVGQWKVYDGPWQLEEDVNHYAGFAKYGHLTSLGFFDLTFHAYHATWLPTEQIPERAIGTAICADAYCALDPTATGETERYIASARLEGDTWRANFYAQYYDWTMYSNPTYFDENGDSAQIYQFDNRWIFGMSAEKTFMFDPQFQFTIGTENRFDDIVNVGVDHSIDRVFVDSFGASRVREGSLALYSEAIWNPFDPLRVIAGLRADYYTFDVGARDAAAFDGSGHDSIVSPKVGLAYRITDEIEFYANWGHGFHSNDARGVVHPTDPVPGLVSGQGYETGARYQMGTFSLSGTYWWLDLDSELKFVGDSNSVEPSESSKRHGFELVAFWRPMPWLALDGTYVISNARFLNSPGAEYIPGAFENAGQAGVSVVLDRWQASVRLRHLGPYPLIEDNSLRDNGSNIVNARGAYKIGNWEIYADLLNVLDSKAKDISYYYESYLPAIDVAPTEGRLSRAVEPRTLRVGAKINF